MVHVCVVLHVLVRLIKGSRVFGKGWWQNVPEVFCIVIYEVCVK
nr:hypothetical protein [uncultured Prevotella sp.]